MIKNKLKNGLNLKNKFFIVHVREPHKFYEFSQIHFFFNILILKMIVTNSLMQKQQKIENMRLK